MAAVTTEHVRATSLSLDDLIDLGEPELERLYREAKTPRIADVSGDLEGRMLTSPRVPKTIAAAMRPLARWRLFPWKGKSFTPHDAERGEGINRVLSDSNRWFKFETFIGRSRAGDFDALQLDYDHRGNPFFIRAIKDEIREIAPGLYLGQAYVMVRGKAHLGLYFALKSR
jgi:hypothetical protein